MTSAQRSRQRTRLCPASRRPSAATDPGPDVAPSELARASAHQSARWGGRRVGKPCRHAITYQDLLPGLGPVCSLTGSPCPAFPPPHPLLS